HLSDMLRYVLYESNNEALPLSKEINFIKSYTELMKIRYQGVVSIKEYYCQNCHGMEIAPMMFIALVENAFKHGISTIEPSFVHINIDVKDRSIVCQVENSNHPKAITDRTNSGIGLVNLKRRLEFLYEGRHSLVTDIINKKYVAELIIHT
ncbi:MAG: histidine kinase, partial [Paludibacteraceae bacterium]|nr:histidine kinase [Paludibacteraceae bacterium]